MYFEEIDLDRIDLRDKKYRISNLTDLKELEKSIEQFGLINPVKLIKTKNRYKVITGWKRLSALKKLNLKKAPANIYIKDELPVEGIYKLIYIDNIHRANDLLKAELIDRIHSESKLDQNELVNGILKFFSLNPSISNFNKFIAISKLSPEIKSSYINEQLSFEQLHMLSEITNSDERTEIFANFLIKFKFNNNETRDLIKDLIIIKQREKVTIKKIAEIVKQNLKDKVNKNELRKEIKKICYPTLTDVEKTYLKRLSDLKLSENVRFVNHPYFESNDLEVRIKFKASEELSNALQNLESNLRKGIIDKLLGVIKEGK